MLAKEIIHEKLKGLANAFPDVVIKYGYNKLAKTHIVELSPLEQYNNNIALDDAWINISMEFMKQFPSEDISFISTDSNLKIEYPEYTFNVIQEEGIWILSASNLQEAVSEVFKELATKIDWGKIVIPNQINFEYRSELHYPHSIDNFTFSVEQLIDNNDVLKSINLNNIPATSTNISNHPDLIITENSWALAA